MPSDHSPDDRHRRRRRSEHEDRHRQKRHRPAECDDGDDDVIDHDDAYHSHERRRRYSEHHHRERGHRRRDSRSRRRHSRSSSSSDADAESKYAIIRERFLKFGLFYRDAPSNFDTIEMMSRNTLPCFDRERDFDGTELLKHFVKDAKTGDRIVCKVLRVTKQEVVLKPECTLTRYRRCLYRIPFPQSAITAVAEMELLACSRGDFISATIAQIDRHELKLIVAVDNYGVPLRTEELPAYYRKLPPPDDLTEIDDLSAYTGLAPLTTNYSAHNELFDKDLDNVRKGPEALRYKLQTVMATESVTKAAALVKEQKFDEGIAIFTEALTTLPDFVPALVGRGAAYANARRLDEAESDLRRAIDLDSEDATASKFLGTILVVRGQEAESSGDLNKALNLFNEALVYSDENSTRILRSALQRRLDENARRAAEAVEQKEKERKELASKEVQNENSKKLAEMEKFIARLKKK